MTSYLRSYILRVLRNGLVQRFSNHFYLFLFCIIFILIISQLKLVWACLFDMLELEDIPGRDFKPSIRTPFGKSFIIIAP